MFKLITFITLSIGLLIGCGQKQEQEMKQEAIQFETANIDVPSIQCEMCVNTIKTTLDKVEGVENVEVDLSNKITTVKFDQAKTNINSLENAIADAGYDANETQRNWEAYDNLPGCCKDGKEKEIN